MMWRIEYAHNDVPLDGRKRRRFNTFYLGVPDQALAWQIAERYIELIRQQHPHAGLYAVQQIDSPWERAITRAGAMTKITGWAVAGARTGIVTALVLVASCVAELFLVP
jgi:hypothetical protein